MSINKKNKIFKLIIILVISFITILISITFNKTRIIRNTISYIIIAPQNLVENIKKIFSDKTKFLSDKNKILKENKHLKDNIEDLLKEINRLKVLEKDNIELRSLIDLKQKYPYLHTIGADIIARDNNNWKNSFLINKGSKDGIKENMIILASGALVGHISKVGLNYSKVIPIIEDNSSVGAVVIRTNDFGFVKGSLDLNKYGLAKMNFINPNSTLVKGDEIVTSNFSKIYPPGILIGYVRKINLDKTGITITATIQPIVNFKDLETVLIVKETFIKNFED